MDKKVLYLSKSFPDLQKLAEGANLDPHNVKVACTLLDKLYEKHEQAFLDRDEELAYIYAMRFLDSLSKCRKLFKSDLKYINALISSNKTNTCFDRAEKLKSALKERYDALSVKKVSAVVDVEYIAVDSVRGSVTAKDVYSKLKGGKNEVMIVDTRPEVEFAQCHINSRMVVNVPLESLQAGCSIVDVNALLKKRGDETQNNIWKERSLATMVIVTDWDMSVLDGVHMIKDAIYKWDAEKTIKEPVLLEGGVKAFLLHYPTMVTDSQYKGPNIDTGTSSIDPGSIKYPDLKTIEAKKKVAEQEARNRRLQDIQDNAMRTDRMLEDRLKDHLPEQQIRNQSPEIKAKNADNVAPVSEMSSLVVDRTLKPNIAKDVPGESHKSKEVDSSHHMKIDRTLKPEVSLDTKPEPTVTPIKIIPIEQPSQIRRLSSNSRTDQDRSDFAARGGAKSIPPPPDQSNLKQPPRITREFDSDSNKYFFYNHDKKERCRTPPDNNPIAGTRKETGQNYVDRVEVLKDHSSQHKQPSTSSTMKRSTSQPNLTEEALLDTKTAINDSLVLGSKPVPSKTFTELSASRLNSFNPTYRNVTPGLTGLRNMGNTCYMSSVVQALSNTKFLTNYILTDNYLHEININNPLGYKGELVREFAMLTKALWKGQYKEISPADFKRMVDSKNEMFRGGEQHDSQEFLLFLLDGLHEDQNSGKRQTKVDLPGDNDQISDVERAQLSWKAHLAINDSVIVRMFQGQYRSKVTCDHCHASSVTFDAFMYLSLPLVTSHNRCSLDDCIKLFLAEEKMTGASQWFCPKCKTNRNARKKIDIWTLPPYLLIHLKRFSCSGQYREKLNTFVDFPMETLSLVDILSPVTLPHKHSAFHLYAVSNHHGNMESGHYTSYCKNAKENAWYNYDDDVVTRIKESDVKTPSAYILFYESYNLKKATFKN